MRELVSLNRVVIWLKTMSGEVLCITKYLSSDRCIARVLTTKCPLAAPLDYMLPIHQYQETGIRPLRTSSLVLENISICNVPTTNKTFSKTGQCCTPAETWFEQTSLSNNSISPNKKHLSVEEKSMLKHLWEIFSCVCFFLLILEQLWRVS